MRVLCSMAVFWVVPFFSVTSKVGEMMDGMVAGVKI
jgi:hypothetical protein